jgi:hypothetical protein
MVQRYKFPANIDDAELKRQMNHPAVKAYLEGAKQFPAALPAPHTPFRLIIEDWEDQEEIREETARIISLQPKHLLVMPGRIIEYCYFRPQMVLHPDRIRNYRSGQFPPTAPPNNFLEGVGQVIEALRKTKDPPPEPMSRHLPEGQEKTFFEKTDEQIVKIFEAKPDADIKTYEEFLKIKITRLDLQKRPEQRKVVKGFHT